MSKKKMFYDDFEVGDTIGYDEKLDGRNTGGIITIKLNELFLNQIKEFETEKNEHNMRIIKKRDD